jgi:hypothetical protein
MPTGIAGKTGLETYLENVPCGPDKGSFERNKTAEMMRLKLLPPQIQPA